MAKTTDFSKVNRLVDSAMRKGLTSLGKDVLRRSRVLAPELTGDLRESGQIDVTTAGQDKVVVGYYVPYANRRHWENNAHPSTRMYLTNALKSIDSLSPYFREEF